MVKRVTSHHLLWFPDGPHPGPYEAPEARMVARGVCRGIITQLNLFGKLLECVELLLCRRKIKIDWEQLKSI